MTPRVTQKLLDKSSVTYVVQTTFPGGSKENKFGEYYRWAYVHKDTPKQYLTRTHPELFEGSREGCIFTNFEQAQRLAEFLIENGRLHCGWEGPEKHREMYRGELKARVVIHSNRKTIYVLEPA